MTPPAIPKPKIIERVNQVEYQHGNEVCEGYIVNPTTFDIENFIDRMKVFNPKFEEKHGIRFAYFVDINNRQYVVMWPNATGIHYQAAVKMWIQKGWKMLNTNSSGFKFNAKRLGDEVNQTFEPITASLIYKMFRTKMKNIEDIKFPGEH